MGQQAFLALIAIGLGIFVGIGLFVPFVAISYRRVGELKFTRVVLWFAALVYFLAIWTFTLLPLPEPATIQCVGMVTDPMETVRDVQEALDAPGNLLTQPAILQLAFNVLLFIPLGFFLRVLGNRGIFVAFVVGFGVSLFVELTQLTGVWGLYPCAYRFFDVADLFTNTSGAVIGSVLSLFVPRSHRGSSPDPQASEPRPVTRGRRALAMLCDGIAFYLVSGTLSIASQVYIGYVLNNRELMVEGIVSGFVGTGVAAALWLLFTLATGQSIGDFTVQLRYTGSPMPEALARLLRWAGGIAALAAVALLPGPFAFISSALILLAFLLLFVTKNGRGLPGMLSGQYLTDARSSEGDAIAESQTHTKEKAV